MVTKTSSICQVSPQPPLLFLELACVGRPKLLTPLANGFIRDGDASFGEKFFDFTKAEAEAMVEPHGVTDNFRGENDDVGSWVLAFSCGPVCQTRVKLTIPFRIHDGLEKSSI